MTKKQIHSYLIKYLMSWRQNIVLGAEEITNMKKTSVEHRESIKKLSELEQFSEKPHILKSMKNRIDSIIPRPTKSYYDHTRQNHYTDDEYESSDDEYDYKLSKDFKERLFNNTEDIVEYKLINEKTMDRIDEIENERAEYRNRMQEMETEHRIVIGENDMRQNQMFVLGEHIDELINRIKVLEQQNKELIKKVFDVNL